MKVLYIIPARSGSNGVPGKNMKELAGRPLIAYSIEIAKKILSDGSLICVSTDIAEISEFAKALDVHSPFIRPENLASHTAGIYDVIIHAVDFYERQY